MNKNPFFAKNTFNYNDHYDNSKNLVDTLKKDGILILTNFCDKKKCNDLKNEFKKVESKKVPWANYIQSDFGSAIHYAPVNNYFDKANNSCNKLTNIFQEDLIKSLIKNYLNKSAYFDRVVLTRNKVKNEESTIIPWHIDHFPTGGKCLKFFLYLTDTDINNGAFSYIPKFHRFQHELNKKYKNFDERVKNLYNFSQIKKHLIEFSKHLFDNGEIEKYKSISKSLKLINSQIKNKDDEEKNNYFSVPAEAGTLIVFDSANLHRGGIVKEGERYVVRSHFLEVPLRRLLTSKNDLYMFSKRKLLKAKTILKQNKTIKII